MRLLAAKVIQKLWKILNERKKREASKVKDMFMATLTIQKFIRKRHSRIDKMIQEGLVKMEETYEYFMSIQKHIEDSAQIKIRYYWIKAKNVFKRRREEKK